MPASGVLSLRFPEPDIAVLAFDDVSKGANVLSRPVLDELAARLDELEQRPDLAGVIVRSGKPGSFIAGADIREFAASFDVPAADVVQLCLAGRRLFQRLVSLPAVSVAAIDGVCLGGGAELAIWCDRRIMATDHKTQFGFPEVKIGLFPGWGGTARTPRIVGLANAVELVTSGESIDGRAAAAMGLASDLVPAERIEAAAIALVRAEQRSGDFRRDRARWSGPLDIGETELVFLGATASAYIQQHTHGNYPAPTAALEVMLANAGADLETACQAEAEGMATLFGSPVNRALVNVFFLTDRNKKDTGIERTDVVPRPIRSVGVVGAGIMGSGIAAANLRREVPVTIGDAVPEALAKGVKHVLEEVSYNKETKGPDAARAIKYGALVRTAGADGAALAGCDLVIEAIVENVDVKQQVLGQLESQLPAATILASNTSTIPITRLAEGLARPAQFCGIHFFNPVRRMPLVEVIRGRQTSDETVATAVAYAKRIGKSPIVVHDGPGFLVNRLLLPYMNEALELLADGAAIKDVERASRAFGMPMGPMTLYDVVGLDTAFYAGRVMWEAFPDRTAVSPILPAMVKAGRLGQKSGAGFFKYKHAHGKGEPDPALQALIEPYLRTGDKPTAEAITNRLFLPMVLEATRVLDEKIVRDVRDVDLGLIFGIGFPPFRGGLLCWADTLGAAKIVELIKPLESLGPRFHPTPMLLEMAANGRRFYGSRGKK